MRPVCSRCGHGADRHGRRGYGACNVGRYGWLEATVLVVRNAVMAGVDPKPLIDALDGGTKPCPCHRLRKRPVQPSGNGGET